MGSHGVTYVSGHVDERRREADDRSNRKACSCFMAFRLLRSSAFLRPLAAGGKRPAPLVDSTAM
jgi:hypothetical protein